jgi:RNA polymerase sigma factor (sigma-70 family)
VEAEQPTPQPDTSSERSPIGSDGEQSTAAPAALSPRTPEQQRQSRIIAEFEDFYRRDFRSAMKFMLSQGATFDQAKDAVDFAMGVLAKKWDTRDTPGAYVRTVAKHHFWEQRARGAKASLGHIQRGDWILNAGLGEADLNVWDDLEWVRSTLAGLPPEQRSVMALTFDGYEPKEIAELLGKTAGAVRFNLHAARSRLKAELSRRRPEGNAREEEK